MCLKSPAVSCLSNTFFRYEIIQSSCIAVFRIRRKKLFSELNRRHTALLFEETAEIQRIFIADEI